MIPFPATEGVDFNFSPNTLTFSSGDSAGTQQSFTLSILQDVNVEFTEFLILGASASESQVQPFVNISNSATFRIMDDDRQLLYSFSEASLLLIL